MRPTTAAATLITALSLLATGCFGVERDVTTVHRELSAVEASALRFDTGPGFLDIVGEADLDTVVLDVWLRTNRDVLAEDERAEDALRVALEPGDGALRAEVRLDDGPAGYWADVILRVPARLAIEGEDGSGDTRIRDVASLDLLDGSGEIEIARVPGAVFVDDDSGELALSDVGPTTLIDESGNITVERVAGPLTITDDSGDVRVTGVEGPVQLEQGSGEVWITRVDGDVDVTDGSGNLTFTDVSGSVRVRDGSGNVDATDVGDLEMLEDGSGEVHVH